MSTVTIVTRTKDRPVLLARAIESVLGQSHEDWEHIIVNDGGDRDDVETLVARHPTAYRDRVRILHKASSVGMQQAANDGIAAGTGTYICIHDDDDSWDPTYLASTVAFLEEKGPESPYQGVIARTELVEESIVADGKIETASRRLYIPLDEINLFRIGFENPFPPIAFCFRRTAYDEVGVFDPRFNVAGDYDFNFRFLRQFEIGVIEGVLAFYHIRIDPRNAAEGNSVDLAAREHKIRYNELKNHYLRYAENERDAALALAFNTARYLVEIEWVTHETRERTHRIETKLGQSVEAISERLESSERKTEDIIAPKATHAYRENLLDHLNRLTERSEQHAENLWKDLNARTRETSSAIVELQTVIAEHQQHTKIAIKAATKDIGKESTSQTLLEKIHALSAAIEQSGRDLWTDLNTRARENVAAIEANAEQRSRDLKDLQATREAASAKHSREMEAIQERMAENAKAQDQSQATQQKAISDITEALEAMSQKLTTLQNGVEVERASRRSLFSLGRLGLIWRRPPPPIENSDSADS